MILELVIHGGHHSLPVFHLSSDSGLDPVDYFKAHTRVSIQVQALECLRLGQEAHDILNGGPAKSSVSQVKVNQVGVVLDELGEAIHLRCVPT